MQFEADSTGATVLLVTNHLDQQPRGGRELLCKLNHDVLQSLLGESLAVLHLKPQNNQKRQEVRDALNGYIDGVNEVSIREIVLYARGRRELSTVFIDGSNLGVLARALKQQLPGLQVISFFHNVESRFFLGSFRAKRSLHAAGVLVANYVAERSAVRFSDKRVCLSGRDSRLLTKVYGRGATHISPMALTERLPAPAPVALSEDRPAKPFALFVGGTFYANREGIEWYVDNVAPRSDVQICIVGRGFDGLRQRLETCRNVRVVGEVEDLSEWYRDARFVIAPIFDGSGMKTKVAEALMYGKKVVGTPEAFSGYEDVAGKAGWICKTASEFIHAVSVANKTVVPAFDQELRDLYQARYSFSAAQARMRQIMSARNDGRVQPAEQGEALHLPEVEKSGR